MIEAANCEAESAQNGVGLVKVMGRDSGYIATYATLASRDVNFCLIPENPFKGSAGTWQKLHVVFLKELHEIPYEMLNVSFCHVPAPLYLMLKDQMDF
jgi:6-phosphofructokinase